MDCAVAEKFLQFAEGFGFGSERHDPGVGCGAHNGDTVAEAGEGVAGACAASDIGGARTEDSGFRGMGSAGTEFNYVSALGGVGDTGGFGGYERLEGDGGQQKRFGDLAFNEGCLDIQNRLTFVKYGAFGDGEQVAGKAEVGEIVPESGGGVAEVGEVPEICNFVGSKAEVQKVVDGMVEPGDHDKIAVAGEAPDGEFERSGVTLFAGGEVARRHGEFVEIGEEAVQDYFFSGVLAAGLGVWKGLIPAIVCCRSSTVFASRM